jgi:hypothetical protein
MDKIKGTIEDPIQYIDFLLREFQAPLSADLDTYKNHACRVFFNCIQMDNQKCNLEKYAIAGRPEHVLC